MVDKTFNDISMEMQSFDLSLLQGGKHSEKKINKQKSKVNGGKPPKHMDDIKKSLNKQDFKQPKTGFNYIEKQLQQLMNNSQNNHSSKTKKQVTQVQKPDRYLGPKSLLKPSTAPGRSTSGDRKNAGSKLGKVSKKVGKYSKVGGL